MKKTSVTRSKFFKVSRIFPFIALVMFTFALAHFFIFRAASGSLENPNHQLILVSVMIIGWLSIPVGFLSTRYRNPILTVAAWIGYIWMGLFNFLFFFSLTDFIIQIFYPHPFSYWILLAGAAVGLWSLYKGLSSPQVIRHTLSHPQLKGLKIVQISDLHIGMLHLNENWLGKVVTKVNDLKPDIIAITGDLVEGSYQDISEKLNVLRTLTSTYDKFYITGNHEYIHQGGSWEDKLRSLDFTILHNQNKVIHHGDAQVLIAGVPDRMIGRFIPGSLSLPDHALSTDKPVDYRILLAHEPASVWDIKIQKCDLILTGHTHGGQIFPFHLLVRLVQPVLKGFKKINGILVFAHQGTGFWGPPMRWFSRSEIVIFEWQ